MMAQGNGEIYREYYRMDNPSFESEQACIEYVSEPQSNAALKDHLRTKYPIRPVESVWCIREDIWNSFIKNANGI
jgi:hypothetical protein